MKFSIERPTRTDKHIPASKLLALQQFSDPITGQPAIFHADLRALIDEAPEVESVVDDSYQEGTAERLRLICSKLGIGAPVSNEEIMLCQFSLLGSIRRKIDEIYIPPPHNTELTKLVGELVEAFDLEVEKLRADRQNYWDKGSDRWLEADTCCNKFIGIAKSLLAKVKGIIG